MSNSKFFFSSIYGIITKQYCDKLLKDEEVGTFVIRFSDSSPGSFAVAYVSDDSKDKIKHYLIQTEDIGPNKSLPEFLKDKHQFQNLCTLHIPSLTTFKKRKEVVFGGLFSKKQQNRTTKGGYVQDLDS